MVETIHIAYCADENYIEHISVSIQSIILNNLKLKLQFHVFLYDVNPKLIKKLQDTSESIAIYNIKSTDIEKYQHQFSTKHISNSTFIRLLVPRLLKDKTDKFLYLDADILCFADISSILTIDITNFICAVCTDSLNNQFNKNSIRLNLQSPYYFNAGVLYINTNKWIDFDVEHRANLILSQNKTLKYADQDALNIVLENRVLPLEPKWNYLYTWMSDHEKENFFYEKDTLPFLVHFTGPRKMWYEEHGGLAQNIYCFYKHFTPWADSPMKSYQTKMRTVDYRVYAKTFFKKKFILKGILFYLHYIKRKIAKK
ncbi:glycosyltransferase family 8 protein [Orbaceae bacterium ESL0721]|nr:glycosyltransferase family 8 protein [Orbaceae bacterium ESL0721]